MRTSVVALATLATALTVGSIAHAQTDPNAILRPGTHPAFVQGGLGFSAGSGFAFNLSVGGGYHFSGGASGPALGGEFELRIAGGVGLLPAARFQWDIPVGNFGLYLSPSMRLGALVFPGSENFPTLAFFDMQPAFDVRLVIADRGMVFARPVGVDILIGQNVGATYQFMLGGGATF